jgi:flagella basal body P-ring formation protein FlgA
MRSTSRRLALLLSSPLLLASGGGSAATLRGGTMLHAPVVRLSDLFDDAGANAARVLGTAPGPGGSIVVQAPQLAAIARQFGVDWRPASSADQAVLERAGRLLPREAVVGAVKAALVAAGASSDCAVELPGFSPPMVPVEASPQPIASELDYDPDSGRFSALLSVTGSGMEPVNLRVAGRAEDTVMLPVAASRLVAGTVLRADDVRIARVHAGALHAEVLHDAADAVGLQLRHPVAAGLPLAVADLMRPPLVLRNTRVQMQLQTPGIALTGEGLALDSGARGERIRVQNPSSRAVMEAEVVGPGQVRVTPGAAPLAVATRGMAGYGP